MVKTPDIPYSHRMEDRLPLTGPLPEADMPVVYEVYEPIPEEFKELGKVGLAGARQAWEEAKARADRRNSGF